MDKIIRTYQTGYLDSDPVGIIHRFDDHRDIEVAGLFGAGIALGRVASIRRKLADLLERMDQRPAAVVAEERPALLRRRLRGFRHRFFGEDDLMHLAANVGCVLREHGSLAAWWSICAEKSGEDAASRAKFSTGKRTATDFEITMTRFAGEFARPVRGCRSKSLIPLVASPDRGSTCKRTLMYLRWMSRKSDGIDFGIWTRPTPAQLIIPMDTHIFRIARLIGLTQRRTPSWQAAVEVTSRLRALDPDDPVKYDFALSRLGIVRGCRGRRVDAICGGCGLRSVCAAYRGETNLV